MVTNAAVAAALAANLAAIEAARAGSAQVTAGTRTELTGANTLFGPTGLIVVPTAYTASHREVAVGAAYGEGVRGPSVNYGVIPYVEIGGAFIDRDAASNKAIANAKVTLIPQNFRNFEIGFGVIDAIDAIERTYYVVGSVDLVAPNWEIRQAKATSVGLKVHAGAGTGMFKEKAFFGGEMLFNRAFSIIGEWDTRNTNGAVRYSYKDWARLQLGFQHTKLYFGMTARLAF